MEKFLEAVHSAISNDEAIMEEKDGSIEGMLDSYGFWRDTVMGILRICKDACHHTLVVPERYFRYEGWQSAKRQLLAELTA